MFTPRQVRESMRLYAVTDRELLGARTLPACVKEALEGGATCIQLREKAISSDESYALAQAIKPLCNVAGVPFIVNDDVALAQVIGADGVHVGQGDMACEKARHVLGEEKIIGVSVQTLEQALEAQKAGADYLGVGAMFTTQTKPDAVVVSMETLRSICGAVDIPVVVIGGITKSTIAQFAGTGIDGVAVVSAIFAEHDIKLATKELIVEVNKLF